MQVSTPLPPRNTRQLAPLYLCLLAKWRHDLRLTAEVKVNQGVRKNRQTERQRHKATCFASTHVCEAPAERWQRAAGQITSDSSFQMPLVKVSIYMSNLRLPAWAPVDYSLPSLKSLAHLGWLLLLNWNVPLEYSSPTARKQRCTLIYDTFRSPLWQELCNV